MVHTLSSNRTAAALMCAVFSLLLCHQTSAQDRIRKEAPLEAKNAVPKRWVAKTPRQALVDSHWMGWLGQMMGGLEPGHVRKLDWPCSITTYSSKDVDVSQPLPAKRPQMTASYDSRGRLIGFRNFLIDDKDRYSVDKEFTLEYSPAGLVTRFIMEMPRPEKTFVTESTRFVYNARDRLVRIDSNLMADSRDVRTGLVALKLRIRNKGQDVLWDERSGMRTENDWDLQLASTETKRVTFARQSLWMQGKNATGSFNYILDAKGGLTRLEGKNFAAVFGYDAFGRVTRRTEENNIAGPGPGRVEYRYHYDAKRVNRIARVERVAKDKTLVRVFDYGCHAK